METQCKDFNKQSAGGKVTAKKNREASINWEKKAYALSIKNVYKRNPTYARSQQYRDSIIRQFTGPDYLYMSFSKKNISRWFDETLTKVSNAS